MNPVTTAKKQYLSPWLLAGVFAVATVAVVGLKHWRRAEPLTLPTLAKRVQATHREWRLVPMDTRNGDLRWGFYVCTGKHSPQDLWLLNRNCDRVGDWAGVVACFPGRAEELCEGHQIDVGTFQLFGDPELLQRIAVLLR